jgi:hypothetical protein
MVKVKEDLVGKIFGRLTVIRQAEDYISPKGRHCARWTCQCSCAEENQVIVREAHLKNGATQSCGCMMKEKVSEIHKKYNKYDLTGEYGIGWTLNTNQEFYFDLEDYDKIKDYCWCENVTKTGFSKLVSYINNITTSMHTVLGFKFYDHIDRNQLNNRKCNLRPATHQENRRNSTKPKNNTSGFIGVYLNKKDGKWKAKIKVDGKVISLGHYYNKADAVKARLKAEAKYYGDFSPQRHLFDEYGITIQNDYEVRG